MSTWPARISESWRRLPRQVRSLVLPLVVLVLVASYPNYYQNLFEALGGGIRGQLAPTVPTMVVMCVYVIMALGLNVVVGYAGLLDLGYVAFYAAGAYIAGWFATLQFAPHKVHFLSAGVLPQVPGIHVNTWLLLVVGAIFAAVLGIIIGLPTLRLRGDYLAIVTLGFGEIIPQAVNNGDDWFGHNVTNGPNGLTPIDNLGFGVTIHNNLSFLPANYRLEVNYADYYYWTGLAIVVFTIFCCIRLRDSRLGRAWVAIREDEIAAAAMGVPLMRTKTWAYAIGAFFGGMAGCFYAIFKSSTFPQDFSLNISIAVLCMVILGGMGNVYGVCLGGAVLAYLNFQGLEAIGNNINQVAGTNFEIPQYTYGIFGIIIVAMMLVRPQGLIPTARRKIELEAGVEGGSLYDAAG
ncbi:MAG TPA: branched-chain amino acid ABC transporter permease [Gaiellales bacterium]|jgi:branched-chain amino acid transport system permease protein|nr:branched-chain amino acid ABC transporter permease [Gaiellales bacterium]